jgi:hypothetical protein
MTETAEKPKRKSAPRKKAVKAKTTAARKAAPKKAKKAAAPARKKISGPIESIGFAAGKLAGLATRTTRALKGAADKVLRSEKESGNK